MAPNKRFATNAGNSIWPLLLLVSASCGDDRSTDSPAPVASTAAPVPPGPAFPHPIEIVARRKPFPLPARYAVAWPIAAAAQADLQLIAQARYCWPRVRLGVADERYADMILANSRLAMPPVCVPEPASIRRLRATVQFGTSYAAPLSPFQTLVGRTSYAKVEAEGCAGLLRDAPSAPMRRRWMTDVRIRRTGDPTIDGAFATILADPRFVTAMGKIRVSLVEAKANVVVVRSLQDACRPESATAGTLATPMRTCQRDPRADAREGLARGLSRGRTGYFPTANDFSTDYPIGKEVSGFTIGDDVSITGAVCLNFGRVTEGPPARQPASPEQAAAAACLLRALGVAGTQASFDFDDLSPAAFRRRVPQLVGFDTDRAFISRAAFDVLALIYADARR